eukprot:TRINITY_DN17096_c0_g1_i3.p1 TRINITY_DN17096_c0_g1~~TRINITY_DN17096_c0_g1_i3.p1  ORF type:complete len:621 (-),score=88.30 TRINITY_DN17096_c0_g1_i3:126-1988(-)
MSRSPSFDRQPLRSSSSRSSIRPVSLTDLENLQALFDDSSHGNRVQAAKKLSRSHEGKHRSHSCASEHSESQNRGLEVCTRSKDEEEPSRPRSAGVASLTQVVVSQPENSRSARRVSFSVPFTAKPSSEHDCAAPPAEEPVALPGCNDDMPVLLGKASQSDVKVGQEVDDADHDHDDDDEDHAWDDDEHNASLGGSSSHRAASSISVASRAFGRRWTTISNLQAKMDEDALHGSQPESPEEDKRTDSCDSEVWIARNDDELEMSNELGFLQRCSWSTLQMTFQACGILPTSFNYSGYVLPVAILLSMMGVSAYQVVDATLQTHMWWSNFINAIQAAGGTLSLICLRVRRIEQLLGPERSPLCDYAKAHRMYEYWSLAAVTDLLALCAFCACDISLRIVLAWKLAWTQSCNIHLSVWQLTSGIFCSIVVDVLFFCHIHICTGLDIMIDSFCSEYSEHRNTYKAMICWKTLRSIISRSSNRLENSFVCTLSVLLAGFALVGADMFAADPADKARRLPQCLLQCLAPLLSSGTLVLYALHRAAGLTEKCIRAKAFVNSYFDDSNFSSEHNLARFYLVQFMEDCEAGFYIKGVRITRFAVMKCLYGIVAVIFGVSVQASRSTNS